MEHWNKFLECLSSKNPIEQSRNFLRNIGSSIADLNEFLKENLCENILISKRARDKLQRFLVIHGKEFFGNPLLSLFCSFLKPNNARNEWELMCWEELNKEVSSCDFIREKRKGETLDFSLFPPTGSFFNLKTPLFSRFKESKEEVHVLESEEVPPIDSFENELNREVKRRRIQTVDSYVLEEFKAEISGTVLSENVERVSQNQSQQVRESQKLSEEIEEQIKCLKFTLSEIVKGERQASSQTADPLRIVRENAEHIPRISEILQLSSDESLLSFFCNHFMHQDLGFKHSFLFIQSTFLPKLKENGNKTLSRVFLDSLVLSAKKQPKAIVEGLLVPLITSEEGKSQATAEIIQRVVVESLNEENAYSFLEQLFSENKSAWSDFLLNSLEKIIASAKLSKLFDDKMISKMVSSFERQALLISKDNNKLAKLILTCTTKHTQSIKSHVPSLLNTTKLFTSSIGKTVHKKLEKMQK